VVYQRCAAIDVGKTWSRWLSCCPVTARMGGPRASGCTRRSAGAGGGGPLADGLA